MNSVDDVCDTFQKMFPDSDIATRMKVGLTKATYIANFGILSVLIMLYGSFNKSPVYTSSSDESLNKVTQACKMNLIIRFFSVKPAESFYHSLIDMGTCSLQSVHSYLNLVLYFFAT